jgi:small ligand-binding sensory domain FIST
VGTILGGMASAGTAHGSNALVLNDRVSRHGLVGVSLKGPVRVDTIVSQGCRAIGPTLVITACQRNVILKLGGRPALEVVREMVESLPDDDKKLLERGLFLGRVVNEYKDRFGRDDFLIRNVVGVEESQGAIATNDMMRVGTTVRFHLRDAATADQDLAMLLDAQKLREPPLGGLLITCNGRGERFFDRPHHDASSIVRAFAPPDPGEELAKGGTPLEPMLPGGAGGPGALPLAGFFAGGEIGPVGGDSYVHGFTACLALFRSEK